MSRYHKDSHSIRDQLFYSDNSSVHSDGTEPDPASSDTDDSNPPGTPVETRQPADVKIQSPGRSFSEKDPFSTERSILQEGGSRGSLTYSMSAKLALSARADTSYPLSPQLLEWLRGQVGTSMHDYELMRECLAEIRQLQLQWEQVGRDGFMTRVRVVNRLLRDF